MSLLRRRGILSQRSGGGGIPPENDVANYFNADLDDSRPPSVLQVDPVNGRQTLLPNVSHTSYDDTVSDDEFGVDSSAHWTGHGNALDFASDPGFVELHVDAASLAYDDRSYRDGSGIGTYIRAGNFATGVGLQGPITPAATPKKLGVGFGYNPVDGSCILARYWRPDTESRQVNFELVRVNPDTTETLLETVSYSDVHLPAILGSFDTYGNMARMTEIDIEFDRTGAIYGPPGAVRARLIGNNGVVAIADLFYTLDPVDAARFDIGYTVLTWGNPNPAAGLDPYLLDWVRVYRRLPLDRHSEYTYGFLYKPSFDDGHTDKAVIQKIWMGHGSEGHVSGDRDERWDVQFGSCLKWKNSLTGTGPTVLVGAQDLEYAPDLTEITVADTSTFNAHGQLKISDGAGNTYWVNYTGKTPTTFTGLTFGAVSSDWGVYPDGALVEPTIDEFTLRGLFSWWDAANGGLGIYYDDGTGPSWDDLGGGALSNQTDLAFVEVGDIGYQSTLATGAVVDFSAITALSADIPAGGVLPSTVDVYDTTGFPANGVFHIGGGSREVWIAYTGTTPTSFTGCTIHYGSLDDPAYPWPAGAQVRPAVNGNGEINLVDGSSLPAVMPQSPNQTPGFVMLYDGTPEQVSKADGLSNWTYVSYRERVGNTLKGCYADPSQSQLVGGSPHTYVAGTKACGVTWYSHPCENGHSFAYTDIRTFEDSFFFLDGAPNPISGGRGYGGWYGGIQPDRFYWTVFKVVGNTITWELWNVDPDTIGATYMIRLRVELHRPEAIAAFGSGSQGGAGPWGWANPTPNAYLEFEYRPL